MKEELIQKQKEILFSFIMSTGIPDKMYNECAKSCADVSIQFAMGCLNKAKDLDIQTVYNQLKQQLSKK